MGSTLVGTKPDLTTQKGPAQPVQAFDAIQMVLALAIVAVLIKWGLPKLVGKFGSRFSSPVGGIKLLESAAFGSGQVQVVEVRGKTLLLGATPTSVTCLADLSEPSAEETVATQAFVDILEAADPQMAVSQTEPDAEGEEEDSMPMHEALKLIADAKARITTPQEESPLDRLNRLLER